MISCILTVLVLMDVLGGAIWIGTTWFVTANCILLGFSVIMIALWCYNLKGLSCCCSPCGSS